MQYPFKNLLKKNKVCIKKTFQFQVQRAAGGSVEIWSSHPAANTSLMISRNNMSQLEDLIFPVSQFGEFGDGEGYGHM